MEINRTKILLIIYVRSIHFGIKVIKTIYRVNINLITKINKIFT